MARNLLRFLAIAQVLCLLALAAPRATAFESSATKMPEHWQLPNGLKVILFENHSFPVVSTQVWYRVGARNERMGATGLSHLVEHLLFRNVGSFRKNELGATIARSGGQFNGFTSDDFTTFFETMPPSGLELALRIEAERMRGATFAPADVREEIAHIQKEFERESKDYSALLSREVRALAYQQHPYHNPTSGWKADVEQLTVPQIKAFYDQYFRPDNATLVIAGDFQPAEAMQCVKKYFGPIAKPANPVPIIRAVEPPQLGERRVALRYQGKQEALELAYHAPSIKDADAPAMTIIEKVLNAPINGRLKTSLIDGKLSTSALSALETKLDPGLFIITTHTAPGATQQKLLDSIDGLTNQLKSQPLSDAELARARNQAEFAYLSEVDGPYRAGFHMGFFDMLATWKSAYDWTDRLRAVTAADVQRAAKKYFNSDNRVVGWLGSPNALKPPAPKTEPPKPPVMPKTDPAAKPKSAACPAGANLFSTRFVNVRMSGYKLDDAAIGPSLVAQSAPHSQPSQASHAATAGHPSPGSHASMPSHAGTAGHAPAAGHSSTAKPASTASQASQASTAPRPATATDKPPVVRKPQQRVLKNGMKIVVYESHISPIVNILGAVRAGEAVEPPGNKGMSALAAAIMNNGSPRRNRAQLQTLQEDLGLPPDDMLQFDPGPEFISFKSRCLSRDMPAQFGLIADALTAQSFPDEASGAASKEQAAFEKAHAEAINTFKQSEEQTDRKVRRALLQSLIAPNTSFYPFEQAERLNQLNGFKAADAKNYFSQFITPDATTIVIVGDTTADQAAQAAEKFFGTWEGKSANKRVAVHSASKRVLRTFIPASDKAKSIIDIGQLFTVTPAEPDYAHLLLADCALNNHPFLSRIAQRFYAEPALAEAAINEELIGRIEPLGNLTSWSLRLHAEAETVSPAVQSLIGELKKLARTGLTSDEINEARRYLLGALPVRNQSTLSTTAETILQSVTQTGGLDGLAPVLANIRASNVEVVNRCIKNTFKPEQSSLVVSGDTVAIKAVRKALSPATPQAATAP